MSFLCNYCKLNKKYTNARQISAHLAFCEQQQEKLKVFKQTLHTKQIKLNSDNLLKNNYAFSQDNNNKQNDFEIDESLYNKAKNMQPLIWKHCLADQMSNITVAYCY